jgi:hypothetical protein
MTPPSITATGSHPFQTYSRISAPEVSLYLVILRPSESKLKILLQVNYSSPVPCVGHP